MMDDVCLTNFILPNSVEAHFRQSPIREKAQQHRQTKVSKQEKAIEPKW